MRAIAVLVAFCTTQGCVDRVDLYDRYHPGLGKVPCMRCSDECREDLRAHNEDPCIADEVPVLASSDATPRGPCQPMGVVGESQVPIWCCTSYPDNCGPM